VDWLNDMLEAIRLAREYVEDGDRDRFFADRRTQQAVILNLLVLGEAATRIINTDPAFIARYPDVPWMQMRGMRNRMAHGYFDVDLEIVWRTVQESLPALAQQLQPLIDPRR
jgi:uncharacterized protein with HEPN domain